MKRNKQAKSQTLMILKKIQWFYKTSKIQLKKKKTINSNRLLSIILQKIQIKK